MNKTGKIFRTQNCEGAVIFLDTFEILKQLEEKLTPKCDISFLTLNVA